MAVHYESMHIQIYKKITAKKTAHFQIKNKQTKNKQTKNNFEMFHISSGNMDCGYALEPPLWGGSNKYPQSMFLSINKKNNVYPCKPQFYYIKVGLKGIKIVEACFRDYSLSTL